MLQDDREALAGEWVWVTFSGGGFEVVSHGKGLRFTGRLAGQGKKVELDFDPKDGVHFESAGAASARLFLDGEQLVLQQQDADGLWTRETLASRCPHAATKLYFQRSASRLLPGRSRSSDVRRAQSSASVPHTAQHWAADVEPTRAATEPSLQPTDKAAEEQSQKVSDDTPLNLRISASAGASSPRPSSRASPKQSVCDTLQHVACEPAQRDSPSDVDGFRSGVPRQVEHAEIDGIEPDVIAAMSDSRPRLVEETAPALTAEAPSGWLFHSCCGRPCSKVAL